MLRAGQKWRWRAGIVGLAAVGMLGVAASCAGLRGEAVGLAADQGAATRGEQLALPDGHGSAPAAHVAAPGGIPFPEAREASALTEHLLLGSDAEQLGLGATREGSALALSGGEGAAYGVWRFNPGGAPPDSVAVLLEAGQTTQAWIGLADFSAGRWELQGPYSQAKTLGLDEGRYRSPGGDVFIAVLVAPGESALVNTLSVRVHTGPNQPPVAKLEASPLSGYAPMSVQFDASGSFDPDGDIIEYAWDFDGDGLYDGFSDEPIVSWLYTESGVFEVKVRVTDDQFARETTTVAIQVFPDPPPVAQLYTNTPKVLKGQTVSLDASGSYDPHGSIVNYSWDLNGDGLFGETTEEWAAQGHDSVSLLMGDTLGDSLVAVRVTDDAGSTDTASLTLTILDPLTLAVDTAGIVGSYTSLAVVNGSPAISYLDSTNDGLKYAYSSTLDGSSGWTAITVDTVGSFSSVDPSLAVVSGKPAISYCDHANFDLKYAYSSTADGSSGWTTITVDAPGNVGTSTSLAVVNGKPAISYFDLSNRDLKYAYSSTVDGSSGWTTLAVDKNWMVGTYTSLAVVNGKPAISYFDIGNLNLKYAYSSTEDGSSGWTTIDVDTPGWVGLFTSLAVVNGKPAISYYDDTNDDLKYAYSSTADGSSGWTTLTVDAPSNVGAHTSLAVVNGKPAISYYDETNADLKYAYSTTYDGSSGWFTLAVDTLGIVGQFTSLAVVNGKPAISYFDGTNFDLKYAVLYD